MGGKLSISLKLSLHDLEGLQDFIKGMLKDQLKRNPISFLSKKKCFS